MEKDLGFLKGDQSWRSVCMKKDFESLRCDWSWRQACMNKDSGFFGGDQINICLHKEFMVSLS